LKSSFEIGLDIIFPDFSTKAILGQDDIYLDGIPLSGPNISSFSGIENIHCSHITKSNLLDSIASENENNILFNLRQYYGEVKTKRQLNLDVPAGFRHGNNFQHQVRDYHLGNKALPDLSKLNQETECVSISSVTPEISVESSNTPTLDTDSSSSAHVPILRCVDKPSTSLPSRMTCTEDFIRASVGFR
jgi:hypothetical protein